MSKARTRNEQMVLVPPSVTKGHFAPLSQLKMLINYLMFQKCLKMRFQRIFCTVSICPNPNSTMG